MVVSLRMNARSSPTGTAKRACSNTKKAANFGVPVPAAATVQVEPKEVEKYIHVHHFKQTGLFGAWFNDPSVKGKKKVRRFFGSHRTAYLAARAQDRAALKDRPSAVHPQKIKLNFKEEDYALDQGLRDTMENEDFGDLLRSESRPTYKKMEPTPLLRYFMAEERKAGHLPSEVPNEAKAKNVIILEPHLINVIMNGQEKRKEKAEIPDLSFLREANEALSLMGIEDPFHTLRLAAKNAKPVDHGLKGKHNKRRRAQSPAGREEESNKRPRQELRFVPMKLKNVAALNKPRALRSSSAKPLPTTAVSTVAVVKPKSVKEINIEVKQIWFPQRPRSMIPKRLASRFVTEFVAPGNARNKHQYKLHKVGITQASERTQTATLPAQVEEAVPMVEGMVPEVEEMVPEVEEMVPEVEKESRTCNFNLFMLADVLALQEA